MHQDLHIFQLTVGREKLQLTGLCRIGQCAGHKIQIHHYRQGTQQNCCGLCPLLLQRKLVVHPGLQGQDLGIQPPLGSGQLANGFCVFIDVCRLFQNSGNLSPVKEFRFTDSLPGSKHALFLRSVLAQHLKSVLQLCQIRLDLCQVGGVPVQKRLIALASQLLRWFTHLHTAHMKQTRQQFIPVFSQGDQANPFHFDNGH